MSLDIGLDSPRVGVRTSKYTVLEESLRIMTRKPEYRFEDEAGFDLELMSGEVALDAGRKTPVFDIDMEDVVSMRGNRVLSRPWLSGTNENSVLHRVAGVFLSGVSNIGVVSIVAGVIVYTLEAAFYNSVFWRLEESGLYPNVDFGASLAFNLLNITFALILRGIIVRAVARQTETIPHLFQYLRECHGMAREAAAAAEDDPALREQALAAIGLLRGCVMHGLALGAALSSDHADTGAPRTLPEASAIKAGMGGNERMTSHVEDIVRATVNAMQRLGRPEGAVRMDAHVREAVDKKTFDNAHLARNPVTLLVKAFFVFFGHFIVPVTLWTTLGSFMIIAQPITLVMYDLLAYAMYIIQEAFDWEKKSPHDTRFSEWETHTLQLIDVQEKRILEGKKTR